MQVIRIHVVPSDAHHPGDGFQVVSDGGSGIIDWDHPITPRRILFGDDAVLQVGHLENGHLLGVHLGVSALAGHLLATHLYTASGVPAGAVTYETEPVVFGRFRHVVVTEDEVGNSDVTDLDVLEQVVNSWPPACRWLVPVDHDPDTGRLEFQFSPSDRLSGA
jgi:hypothetical protein